MNFLNCLKHQVSFQYFQRKKFVFDQGSDFAKDLSAWARAEKTCIKMSLLLFFAFSCLLRERQHLKKQSHLILLSFLVFFLSERLKHKFQSKKAKLNISRVGKQKKKKPSHISSRQKPLFLFIGLKRQEKNSNYESMILKFFHSVMSIMVMVQI